MDRFERAGQDGSRRLLLSTANDEDEEDMVVRGIQTAESDIHSRGMRTTTAAAAATTF